MILGTVVGTDRVVTSLLNMGPKAKARAREALLRQGILLQTKVKSKLSGDVLHLRSHRLRDSITPPRITERAQELFAEVGTNVVYAAAHEYGFQGTVNVREHLRRTKGQMARRITGKKQGPQELGATTVKAHLMKMNLPERSFLRSALREHTDQIIAALDRAVNNLGGEE